MIHTLPDNPQRRTRIQESHLRSIRYGVDPKTDCAPEHSRLSAQQLRTRTQENRLLMELSITQMKMLTRLLSPMSCCVALADGDGYILHVLGHGSTLLQYKKRHCLPGYRWTERDMGTCVIGLVLHDKKPIIMFGDEMFRSSTVTNAAAPIFDSRDAFIGVFTLSGPQDEMHIHSLGLVIQAAATIRLQLIEREKTRELAIHNQYMRSLLESDHRGIVTLDPHGGIVQINKKAKQLLALSEKDCARPIDDLLRADLSFRACLERGKGINERELTCRRRDKIMTHIVTLDPITLASGEAAGGLLLVMEKKRLFSMISEFAGLKASFTFDAIVGNSESIRQAIHLARIAAASPSTVLLCGPTGTGKELFAQAIHNASPRRERPFVVINCGAIPKELLESELFGYEEGSFTGASKGGRPGKLELAHGGTLFLDEIGDMPFDMQVKILRVLTSGEVQRLGGSSPVYLDLRIIAATNVDLKDAIARKAFRPDLFYRLSTLTITIPSLRERGDDIIVLARFFLSRFLKASGRTGLSFSPQAMHAMRGYAWPGNIRQLKNAVERAVNTAAGTEIEPPDLGIAEMDSDAPEDGLALESLEEAQCRVVARHMLKYDNNISKVSSVLGISRPTLYRWLKACGIPR